MTSDRLREIGASVRHAALTGTDATVTIDHKEYRVSMEPVDETMEAEKMNETRRSELVERIRGEILCEILSVYTDGYDHEVSDIVEHARRVIALVTKHRDAEIREALESEDVVSMFARMMWVQDDKPGVGPSSSYKMAARYNIDALKKAIGLHGDGTGGQG